MVNQARIEQIKVVAEAAIADGELALASILYGLCGSLCFGTEKELAVVVGKFGKAELERIAIAQKDDVTQNDWPEEIV